jgi:TonB-linked SusC/RagA family outer membrane protein
MNTKNCRFRGGPFGFSRILLAAAFALSAALPVAAREDSTRVNIRVTDASLPELFGMLKLQAGMSIMYSNDDTGEVPRRDYAIRDATLLEALNQVLSGTGLECEISNRVIIVRKATRLEAATPGQPRVVIRGRVTDASGQGVPGASVVLKGTRAGRAADREGRFELEVPAGREAVLVISFIGMETREVTYRGEALLEVALSPAVTEIGEVIVTGIFTRKAESFTGAATSASAAELRRFGNQNLLQALQHIDPSFTVIESVEHGSDPNRPPEVQVRGASSLPDIRGDYQSNPNQPLFILDGFEASVEKVFDLDMNRVATVTLLKDAAAKAIYGSRAANGVVVIETVLPGAGQLKVNYAGDLNVTAPDLTSYDLTDAAEKLQVELDAQRYAAFYPTDLQFRMEQYNEIQRGIARGVNTYWLAKPLRVGVGHKHSLFLEGGDDYWRYGIDLSYHRVAGVMKRSGRENVAGAITLSYRYRGVTFRNMLSVTFNTADDSPYGAFSEYAKLNPYWTPTDEHGRLKRVLGQFQASRTATPTLYYNPLYNAAIGTKNRSSYTEITDNFYAEWQAWKGLSVIGRFGYARKQETRDDFYPGNHTRFTTWEGERYFKRGEYTIVDGKSDAIKVDVSLNYSARWQKHLLFANANWALKQETSDRHGMQAWGFLNDKMGHVAFAKQYAENGRPSGDESNAREIALVGAVNYSYDNRYLADFSYRANGSSIYGADNRWGNFWSAGVGWNLHEEAFLRGNERVRQLKIRGSVGYTGSQNFDPYQAMATYTYFSDAEYDNIVGAYLLGLANDHLRWQRTRDVNVGIDARLGKGLSVRFDYYTSDTDDLLIDFSLPGSTGFPAFKENLGKIRNTGFDANVSWRVYDNPARAAHVTLFASVAGNKNKITRISDALAKSNDAQGNEDETAARKPYARFEEGQSTSAIWAVRSAGIDPVTGRELFINKQGEYTYDWKLDDQVALGDANPRVRGNFGFNAEYRGLALNTSFTYRVGGKYYNQTLVDRVENADVQYNVDRRVFTGTWKNPGDVTFFKRITDTPTLTRPTSRFVERQDEWTLASLSLSYELARVRLGNYSLERTKVSFYMADVFRVSTVKAERGLAYPFARSFSLSLQTTF